MNPFRLACILLVLVPLLFFSANKPAWTQTSINFFYFNPDSVQSNFSLLTNGMENFFRESGLSVHFQAFSQQSDFDKLVRQKKPVLVLVPSWYYKQYGKSLSLSPLLTSLNQGKPNYTKLLLARKSEVTSLDDLQGKTLAMTTMGPDTDEQLSRYFNIQGLDSSKLNIIATPKDADALYALALGQVDAAVVGETTVKVVGKANPRILTIVEELAQSQPIPMPLLCVIEGSIDSTERERLKRKFLEGGRRLPLPIFMNMLQITGWVNAML